MIDNPKWKGCPYDVKKHNNALRNIALGVVPDPFGRGEKYHNGHIQLAYEWLIKKKEVDRANGIYTN